MDFRQSPMLDFTNKKPPPAPFSLDRKDHLRRSHMRKREWRSIIMLPIAIFVVAIFIHFLVQMSNDFGTLAKKKPISDEVHLVAMPRPLLDRAAPMPLQEAVDQDAGHASRILDTSDPLPEAFTATDALGLAYAKAQLAQDEKSPPVPQHLMANDLLLSNVHSGTPILINGRLDDVSDANGVRSQTPYQRLLIALDGGQWAIALASHDLKMEIGDQVQVVGRYLGFDTMPAQGGSTVKVPLLAARVIVPIDVANAGSDQATVPEWHRSGSFVMPEGLFDDLDDERTYVESRPYYYLINQVRLEQSTPGVFEHAYNLNEHGNDVHQEPTKFRDRIMQVRGAVYRAWEDQAVAQDKPFGNPRVIRVLIYRTDYGPISEDVHGTPQIRNRLVERLFELAIVSSQPLPKVGDDIIATGHFLKFHAIPVEHNEARDEANGVDRQSDNVYTYFLVTGPYRLVPPPSVYSFTNLEISVVSTVLVMIVTFWFLSRKERKAGDVVQNQVRMLRRTRQQLIAKKALASPQADGSASAAPVVVVVATAAAPPATPDATPAADPPAAAAGAAPAPPTTPPPA
jgi:hypothetical protein